MLITQIQNDMKQAMRNKDKKKLSTLRMLLATVEKVKVTLKVKDVTELSDDVILNAINKNIKQLNQEIEALEKAGRDTFSQETEKELLNTYLPKQMSEEEIKEVVEQAVADVNAEAGANIGMVMKLLSPLKGKADMKLVSKLVKEEMK
jgi:uncharacterized protein